MFDLERDAFLTGTPVDQADAYTINGKPGDMYSCSDKNHKRSKTTFFDPL